MQILKRGERRRELLRDAAAIHHPKGMASQEPAQWALEFQRWLIEGCCIVSRASTSIAALHIQFCEWCTSNASVGCSRRTLESLLISSSFVLEEGFARGLVPVSDLHLIAECLQPLESRAPQEAMNEED